MSYIIKNNDYFVLDEETIISVKESSNLLKSISLIDLICEHAISRYIVLTSLSLSFKLRDNKSYVYPSSYINKKLNPEKFAILDYTDKDAIYTVYIKPYISFYFSRKKIGTKYILNDKINESFYQPQIINEQINRSIQLDMPVFNILKKLSTNNVSTKNIKDIDPDGDVFKFAFFNYVNHIITKKKDILKPLINSYNTQLYIFIKPNKFNNKIYSLSYFFLCYTHTTNNTIKEKIERKMDEIIVRNKNNLPQLKRYIDIINRTKRIKSKKDRNEEMNLFNYSYEINDNLTYCCNVIFP
ncbi:MAG: hypothetical protein QXF12_05375 [Candidatus Aenigmatarchaeota archaeon]